MKIDSIHSYAYAKAVFRFAVEQNKLQEWQNFLSCFVTITKFESVEAYCDIPLCLRGDTLWQQPLKLLTTLLQDMQISLTNEMINFIHLLLCRKRLELLPHISKIYQEMNAEYSKILHVKIETVQQLTDDERQKLIDSFAKQYGCAVELEQKITEEIIGGAIVHIKDKVIDCSVVGQLRRLYNFIS